MRVHDQFVSYFPALDKASFHHNHISNVVEDVVGKKGCTMARSITLLETAVKNPVIHQDITIRNFVTAFVQTTMHEYNLGSYSARFHELKSTFEQLSKKADEQTAAKAKAVFETEQARLAAERAAETLRADAAHKQTAGIQEQLVQTEAALMKIKDELAAAQKAASEAAQQMKDATSQHAGEQAKLQKAIDEAEARAKKAEDDLLEQNNRFAEKAAKMPVEVVVPVVAERPVEVASIEDNIEAVTDFDGIIEGLRAETKDLKAQVAAGDAAKVDLQGQVDVKANRINELEALLNKANRRIGALIRRAEAAEAHVFNGTTVHDRLRG